MLSHNTLVKKGEHTHHMFIPKKELNNQLVPVPCTRTKKKKKMKDRRRTYHNGHRIIKLIHGVELGHLVDITQVNHGKVLDLIGNLGQDVILPQTVWVAIFSEPDDHQTLAFAEDALVDVPGGAQMRKDDGSHGGRTVFRLSIRRELTVGKHAAVCMVEDWGSLYSRD